MNSINTESVKKQNPNQVAHENELKVLTLLRDFGHLRRVDLALGVWPHSPPSSSEQMVRRTITRLLSKKHIVMRHNSHASESFILGRLGAGELRLRGLEATAGYNIQSVNGPQFFHRTLGSAFLLKKRAEGAEVYGEYALMQDWCPLTRNGLGATLKKMPDGVLLWDGEPRGLQPGKRIADWVEVESNYKPIDELQKVLDVGWNSGIWLDEKRTILLDKLYLVFNKNIKNHESTILKAVRAQIKSKPVENLDALLESIILVRVDIALPLRWLGHEEISLFDLKHKLAE